MRFLKAALCVWVVLAPAAFSGHNMKSLEFMVGNLNPNQIPAGIVWDAKYGIAVDESVDILVGVSYFHRGYTKKSTVNTQSSESGDWDTKQVEMEYSTNLLPVSVNATVHLPMSHPFGVYFGAGLSWQFLFNKENNYVDDVKETRNFNGGGWVARAGAEMKLGTRSSLIGEVHYNACKVKGNEEKKQGLPTWEEVDLTGLGFKVGLRMELY